MGVGVGATTVLSQEVIPKVTITATPTALAHLRAATINITQLVAETFSPGTSGFVDRAVTHQDWGGTLEYEVVPGTIDPASNELFTDLAAGNSSTMTFVEPSGNKTFTGEIIASFEGAVQLPGRYVHRWTYVGASAVVISSTA